MIQGVILKGQDSSLFLVTAHEGQQEEKKLAFKKPGKAGRFVLKLTSSSENKKVVAIGLAIALGPFGAHRLYLGTDEKVPIVYTLTLGGGLGILPLIDIIHILTARDLARFENNPHVFIWNKKKGEE